MLDDLKQKRDLAAERFGAKSKDNCQFLAWITRFLKARFSPEVILHIADVTLHANDNSLVEGWYFINGDYLVITVTSPHINIKYIYNTEFCLETMASSVSAPWLKGAEFSRSDECVDYLHAKIKERLK